MVIRALLRPLFLLALLSLVLPSLAAAQGVDVKTVGMVVPASKTDLGWNQQGADGLTAVARELGITAKIQENGGYDDRNFRTKGDNTFPLVLDHDSLKPEKLDPYVAAFFDEVDFERGDSLITFGWAMAEDLAKLA